MRSSWATSVTMLRRNCSCCARLPAIALNAWANCPISSSELTGTRTVRSPFSMRWAASVRRSTGRRMRLDNASVTTTAARPAISAPNRTERLTAVRKAVSGSLRAGHRVEIERAHERPSETTRPRAAATACRPILPISLSRSRQRSAIRIGNDDPLAADLGQLRDLGLDTVPAVGSVVGSGQEEGEASVI